MDAIETKMDPSVSTPGMGIKRNDSRDPRRRSSRNPRAAHQSGVSDYGAPDRARSLESKEKQLFEDRGETYYRVASAMKIKRCARSRADLVQKSKLHRRLGKPRGLPG